MPDNLHKESEDSKLISLTEPYEVKNWCKALNCTEKELRDAVAKVGHSAAAVEKYIIR